MATVLLIDDNAAQRASIRRMLEAHDHVVEVLPDGRRALQRCRARPFDLVITDLIMPGQEGIETIQRLRQADVNVRIIAISDEGHHTHGVCYLRTARLLGADETFVKPLRADQLQTCIRDLLAPPADSGDDPAAPPPSADDLQLRPSDSSDQRGTFPREERPPRTARPPSSQSSR